mgnify:CR=1 FL=1
MKSGARTSSHLVIPPPNISCIPPIEVNALISKAATDSTVAAVTRARLLNGSYYGQTVQIWAALFVASLAAAALVWMVGFIECLTLARMGAKR